MARRLYHNRMRQRIRLLTGLAAAVVAGCATPTGVQLRGGQTEAALAEDRTQCLPFVQAHTETSTELAKAACLIARGYRVPVEMTLGTSRIGELYTDARGDATSMVRDFQGCRVEAASAPMPEAKDTDTSGMFSWLFSQFYPRGFFSKAQTSDEWIAKAFGECLTQRGYAVTEVTTHRR